MSLAPLDDRIRFLTELGRRLHQAGVTAARLEGGVRSVAQALHVHAEVWATPTGLLLSLGDGDALHGSQQTRVLRLEPGDVDLGALAALDRIADDVVGGRLDVAAGHAALAALDRPSTPRSRLRTILAFGLAAASVAGLLRTDWVDIAVAAVLGLVIGWISVAAARRPHVAAAGDAIAALVATLLATAFAHFITPLSLQTVTVAALIVLMPGLTLTTAVTELATQQLASGTARLAGAITTLLKLTFGSVAATELARALGWTPRAASPATLPPVVEFVALVGACVAFAVLFRAARRDVPVVMLSAAAGYLLTRVAGAWLGLGTGTFAGGVFFASLLVTAAANAYGRIARRPGALVRVPGIMLLVPGSVGFRSLSFVMERDLTLGFDTGVAVLSALVALVAGLLFGGLLVPPRRHL